MTMPTQPEIPYYIGVVGTLIGSSVYAAYRAHTASRQTESVRREMDGPDDEPSLRQLVKHLDASQAAHRIATQTAFADLGARFEKMETRVSAVENAVFSDISSRVSRMEGAINILTSPAIAVRVRPRPPEKG